MVPTTIPPIVAIIIANIPNVTAVLHPQITLATISYAYLVVPKGCSGVGSSKGVPPEIPPSVILDIHKLD